jgi:hypothetical protein
MTDDTFHASRRGILRGAAASAAGALAVAVGLERLGGPSSARAAAPPGSAATPEGAVARSSPVTTLALHGRGWNLTGAGHRPGRLPGAGERGSISGELTDPATGDRVGTFRSATFHGGREEADLELHTFDLGDGMLVGMGASQGGEGTFAIIGGTGRFAGARGAYAARQGHREVGGDGGAEFAFTILS